MKISLSGGPAFLKSGLKNFWRWGRWLWRFLRALFLAYAVAFSVVGTLLLGFACWKIWRLYDSVAGLESKLPAKTSFMEYREEQWEDSGKKVQVRWDPVPLTSISKNLQNAVLTGEDDRFYQHNGFDLDAMERAFWEAKTKGSWKRGGSTITQQLAKNLYLSPKRSLVRKGKEALYTAALEHFLSKERIMEVYLNVIEWGPGIYGAEAASRYYFGIHASQLDLDQAARLAAVLPKPLKVRPDRDSKFMNFRKSAILQNMRQFKGLGQPAVKPEVADDDEEELPEAAEIPDAVKPDSSAAAKPESTEESKPVASDSAKLQP
ncbi:MAG: monofunctional biosynthetic peptidoglycan transglycosylase [Fibrobacteres bacterium]|nr:monofunctional biosynthetic peptidoglycan transglycosylase [Fibrobacterota bacterium]